MKTIDGQIDFKQYFQQQNEQKINPCVRKESYISECGVKITKIIREVHEE